MNEQLGDIPIAEFRKHLSDVTEWIATFRENIRDLRISPNEPPGSIRAKLCGVAPESGESLDDILRDFREIIMPGITHWAHPMFLGYFGATTTNPGILAEMLTSALNVNVMMWSTSPAATELETHVLEWLQQWLQLPNDFSGVTYDTASVGSMHALAAAREKAAPETRKHGLTSRSALRVYVSDQAHSSIVKAAIALGVGEENVRKVESDADFRMKVDALAAAITEDIRAGIKPMAVVATVGTTSTASVDPVREIARVCRDHYIWFHIDAAYGGGLCVVPEMSWVLDGFDLADSIVVNPHKMLFVPFDFSALYVRDIARLRDVFTLVPEYLRGGAAGADINYMDFGVQLGRRFRALKAWMVWRTFGRNGMAARIREHIRLAHLFTSLVKNDPQFELAAPTVIGVVCFRFIAGGEENADSLSQVIVERINASGRSYLMQTKLRGRSVIRFGLGNILTTEDDVRCAWDLIQQAAAGLLK
jgi:aromatic-L-amino-acid decarboxylase